MEVLYEDLDEKLLHDRAIDALASEMQVDAIAIRSVYERHYMRLREFASVRDYLPVLVARHTRSALRRRRLAGS